MHKHIANVSIFFFSTKKRTKKMEKNILPLRICQITNLRKEYVTHLSGGGKTRTDEDISPLFHFFHAYLCHVRLFPYFCKKI